MLPVTPSHKILMDQNAEDINVGKGGARVHKPMRVLNSQGWILSWVELVCHLMLRIQLFFLLLPPVISYFAKGRQFAAKLNDVDDVACSTPVFEVTR